MLLSRRAAPDAAPYMIWLPAKETVYYTHIRLMHFEQGEEERTFAYFLIFLNKPEVNFL